ncbi:mechanosensitive ion channel family protein [Sporosarcina sp. G11-34]|uniref:mechanosensitive ion channel family protein n=1 Tax=Sporosarcina sp. G11-34 TaxID=2849605 RepID=UPI0022A8D348|nr:mechanosensitive ion channel family protein [Sporosarcina sp. G11-34]MCZ2259043.1 mechanosensitive ion channel family protein [Sporosarcina sp. G11-34]
MSSTESEKVVTEFAKSAAKVEKFLFNQETWLSIGMVFFKILVIILLAVIVVSVGKSIIRRVFTIKLKTRLRPSERREKTLIKLLENALTYVVYFAAIIAVLEAVDIKVAGLLAGAGVLGLAVGFGAQSLVKDVISGFFIIFEDQFSVGDYVQIGNAVGTVEEIGLRTTKVSAYGGEIYIIPNGDISEVVNYSINNSLAIVDIRIAYETDIERAEELIEQFLADLSVGYEELISQPTLIGIQDLSASEVVLRVTAETQPVMQWAFARKFRKDLKLFLDAHGIEIPYPKMVTYQRKEGG